MLGTRLRSSLIRLNLEGGGGRRHYANTFQMKKNVNYFKEKRRLKATETALEHFDIQYSKVFGHKWRSIRLGLLSPNKHVAVLNSYLNQQDLDVLEKDLKLQRSIELGAYYEKYWKKYQRLKIREKILEERRAAKREMCRLNDLDETTIDTDTDISDSEYRKHDPNLDLTSSTAEDAKFLFSTDTEDGLDESRFFNPASTNLNLNTFVPITELISQEEDALVKRDYQLNENYEVKFDSTDKNKLEIPDNLKVYMNRRGVLTYSRIDEDDYDDEMKDKADDDDEDSDLEDSSGGGRNNYENVNTIYSGRNYMLTSFPYPKKNHNKSLLNYFVMDSASILPVLCLDLKDDDLVGDFCAAPGGKALSMLLTKKPSRILLNDSSLSRSHRLQTVMRAYLPRSEINRKIEFRNVNAEGMMEKDTYDKILLDVPCTNDKISVLSNQNNLFKTTRLEERIRIPDLQIKILLAGLQSLKKGGNLIYSTCSLSPSQNDFVIRAALERIENETLNRFAVCKLKEPLRPLRALFKFHNCEYGQLVLPFVPSNSGPMYISKIRKLA